MTKQGKVIIFSAIAAILAAMALILVFVILPLFSKDNANGNIRTFDIESVEIQLDGKTVTEVTKNLGSEDFTLDVVVNGGETDYSKYDKPMITWGFIDNNLNCTVDNGKVSLGDTLGQANLRVTVKSNNEKSAETIIHIVSLPGSVLKSIEVTNPPNNLQYIEGQAFDKTGLVVVANFQDYSAKVANYTVNPSILALGYTQAEITYSETGITQSAYIPVSVAQKTLQSISITKSPDKTSYTEGQKFDKTGLQITAHYEYMSEIVEDFYFDEDKVLSPQDTSVTIFYTENHPTKGQITKTATQPITVACRTLQSISVDAANAKLNYVQGQTFDKTGLMVTANYNEGMTLVVTNYVVDTTTKLTHDITGWIVSYTEYGVTKTATLKITVDEPYTNFREIIFADFSEASLTWLYYYTTNDGDDVIDYQTYDEPLDTYVVPVGAIVTINAINPAIIDFIFNGEAQGLTYPKRSLDFTLEQGTGPLNVSFKVISDRVTVTFTDGVNNLKFSYPSPWNGVLAENDLEQIAFIFNENDLYYYIYTIDGAEYTFAGLTSFEFNTYNIYDIVVTVEKKERTNEGTPVTLVYWPGLEVIITVDPNDEDWKLHLPVIERAGYEFLGWTEEGEKMIANWQLIDQGYNEDFVGVWHYEIAGLVPDPETDEPIEVSIECQIILNSDGTYKYETYLDDELNLSLYGIYKFNEQSGITILSIETDGEASSVSYGDFGFDLSNLLTANVLIVNEDGLNQFSAVVFSKIS